MGQVTGSAGTSQPTRGASGSCDASLKDALECLDKSLDAYEKATAVIAAKDQVIAAKDVLIQLHKDWITVKDQMIKAQTELITFYDKQLHGSKRRIRKLLETAGKVVLIAAGIMVGRGL